MVKKFVVHHNLLDGLLEIVHPRVAVPVHMALNPESKCVDHNNKNHNNKTNTTQTPMTDPYVNNYNDLINR